MHSRLVKKSGLTGHMRGTKMPMHSLLTKPPMEELKAIVKARGDVYKAY